MELKSRKIPHKKSIVCPICKKNYTELSGHFHRKTTVAWYVVDGTVQEDGLIIRCANSICVGCLKGAKAQTEQSRMEELAPKKSKDSIAHRIAEKISSGVRFSPMEYLARDVYDPITNAIDSLIDEI